MSLYSTINHIVTVDSLSPALDPLTWENQRGDLIGLIHNSQIGFR